MRRFGMATVQAVLDRKGGKVQLAE